MSYLITQLKKLPCDEAILRVNQIELNMHVSMEKMRSIEHAIQDSLMVYNKDSKESLTHIYEDLLLSFNDYRAGMLKSSTKKNLPTTIISVCQRTLKQLLEEELLLTNFKNELKATQEKVKNRKLQSALSDRVYAVKDDYMNSFENEAEGQRQWDCLISCVEEGFIKEKDLPSYGIYINSINNEVKESLI